MTMRRLIAVTALLSSMALGCGGDNVPQTANPVAEAAAPSSSLDPCSLLTYDEIASAVGWKPDSSTKEAGNCTYHGPSAYTQNIMILLGQGMPDMPDSRALREWRAKQYANYTKANAIVEPIEGLGVPAIRNEFGSTVAVEMVVGKQLVTVTGSTLKHEEVQRLAGFVLARMKS